ncbi:adenine phosphoribosyltransferase [Bifidobacterium aemilianum]|uniref:Adenine phosphoribosyltransferase n=1 Tax=Bifidobacterium aemilianum TaxID=2493120 RepID=A0A366K8R7_9BIFI|nr:adenine phosphoribosyltransferase [Bifidobacterium aemilianum]RBP98064.1 adenine phosphoribosyltransferase [Bifidobacterium aemilianum]
MTASDIKIDQLSKVDSSDAEYLISRIRSIPDFPSKGVLFRDYLPLMADAKGLQVLMNALEAALPVPADSFDAIAGLEARGFLCGPILAARLNKGFVAVRKAGKLPPATISESYTLEYGQASIEIEDTAVSPGQRVLIFDDLIATGGTAQAAARLIARSGGTVAGYSFVMELEGLGGIEQLGDYPCSSLVTMPA